MTEKGGKAWIQTIFYPFMYASAYGNDTTLKPIIESDKYSSKTISDVPYLETSVIDNHEKRELVVFAVNRSLNEDMELEIATEKFGASEIIEHIELYSDDLKMTNSPDSQNVKPCAVETDKTSSENHTVNLKKHSWNMIRIKY